MSKNFNLKVRIELFKENETYEEFVKRCEDFWTKKGIDINSFKDSPVNRKETQSDEKEKKNEILPEVKNKTPGVLGDLSFDILFQILSFFYQIELLDTFMLVSKDFYKASLNPVIWKELKIKEEVGNVKIKGKGVLNILRRFPVKVLDLSSIMSSMNFALCFRNNWPNLEKVILNNGLYSKNKAKNEIIKFNPQIEIVWIDNVVDGVNFWLKTINGTIHYVEVPSLDITFLELKHIVFKKYGYPIDSQRYIYAGCESRTCDNNKLSDVGLQKDSIMHIVFRLRG